MQVPTELKIKYLRRRIEDIEKVRQTLESEDYSYALKVGHQLKGNAVTFDFPQMASIGDKMERAAQVRDKEQVRSLIQQMEYFVQNAQAQVH